MFVTYLSYEHICGTQNDDLFFPAGSVSHLYGAIEHDKNLGAIINVPMVRFISPVQSDRGPIDLREISRAPGLVCFKRANICDDLRHDKLLKITNNRARETIRGEHSRGCNVGLSGGCVPGEPCLEGSYDA
jgi:hypothetical protein